MDEVLQYIIEEIAFDGVAGSSLDRIWSFLASYHSRQGHNQNIDEAYQLYVLGLLKNNPEILVSEDIDTGQHMSNAPCSIDQDFLSSALDSSRSFVLRTTESRQWYALTGHDVDHKQVPAMAFALMCIISRHRSHGVKLPDLCKESGQDKRSAPQRCANLVQLGLIQGFPILTHNTHTTLYVHRNFASENALQREQQDDYGQAQDAVDTHALRVAISRELKKAKSQILKAEDLYQLIGMTNVKDQLPRRRAGREILLLIHAGYIARVRVPGVQSGKYIRCFQLQREYTDTDLPIVQRIKYRSLKAEETADEDMDTDPKGKDEELDLLLAKRDEFWTADYNMHRNLLLDYQIYMYISDAGSEGRISHQIGTYITGPFWQRPFDEILKRLGSTPEASTQPREHLDLAIGPPVEESQGRIRQYRYNTLLYSSTVPLPGATSHIGQFAPLDFKAVSVGTQRNSSNHAQNQRKRPVEPKPDTPKKRGRPTKEMVAQRKAQANASLVPVPFVHTNFSQKEPEQNNSEDDLRSSAVLLGPNITNRAALTIDGRSSPVQHVEPTTMSCIDPALRDSTENCSDLQIGATNSKRSPNEGTLTPKVPNLVNTGRRLPALIQKVCPSDRYRAHAISSTAEKRRQVILNLIRSKSGITTFDVEFVQAYNRTVNEGLEHKQNTDRRTLRRDLSDLEDRREVYIRVRVLHKERPANENDAESTIILVPISKTIVFLHSIDPNSQIVNDFCDAVEARESERRRVYIPPIEGQTIPRPEMEIIPTTAQVDAKLLRLSKLSGVGQTALTKQEYLGFRARLPSESDASTKAAREWSRDGSTLPDLAQIRAEQAAARNAKKAEARAERAARSQRAVKKPALRPIKPNLFRNAQNAEANIGKMLPPPTTPSRSSSIQDIVEKTKDAESPLLSTDNSPARKPLTTPRKKRVTPKTSVRRGDSILKLEFDEQTSAALSDTPLRRKRFGLTELQEDILIRSAALSMLFFSKSDSQPIIQWPMVMNCLPDIDEEALRGRYTSMRSKPNEHRKSFIMSTTFVHVYNRAVLDKMIPAIPRDAPAEAFDLMPYVQFSRRFDVHTRLSSAEKLPSSYDAFWKQFNVARSNHHEAEWRDKFYDPVTNINKHDAIKSRALCDIVHRSSTSSEALRIAAIKANLLTPDQDFDPNVSAKFMAAFGSKDELQRTLEILLDQNLIVPIKGDLTRIIPNCNFQLSASATTCLKHSISAVEWRNTNSYENDVEHAFDYSQTLSFPALASDGASMAAIELGAHRQVDLDAETLPFSEGGIIQGYEVKKIDSMSLDFEVMLSKGRLPLNRSASLGPSKPSQPVCWYDINDKLLPVMYSALVSLAMQFTIQRGVLEPEEFMRFTKPLLLIHEVRALLDDLCAREIFDLKEGLFYLRQHYYHALA